MTQRKILGLVGPIGVGKTTLAHQLQLHHQFKCTSFAAPLKLMVTALLEYQGAASDILYDHALKEESTPVLNGQTPRYAMQTLGTEWGRHFMGNRIWINVWKNHIGAYERVVVDDVRFDNEVEVIRQMGGKILRLIRSEIVYDFRHQSEVVSANLPCDHLVMNVGTPQDMLSGIPKEWL